MARPAGLIAYALPAAPLAALYFPVFVLLIDFYASDRGLSYTALGAALLGIRVFDAISDPAIGYLSDRTSRRFGRRKLWLLIAIPFVTVGAWALFVPPDWAGIGWFSGALLTATLGWTLAMAPYYAWGAEMSGDYDARSRIALWREGAGLLGTILAAFLFWFGGTADDGLRLVAWLIVLGYPVATLFAVVAAPEPKDYSTVRPRIGDALRILIDRPIFRRLLVAYLLNGAANGASATLFAIFVSYRLDAPEMSGPLLMIYFCAAIIGAPIWMWASGQGPKNRIWCLAMIYAGVIFAGTALLGPGDWPWFALICLLSGIALSADLALPASIQADLVDEATAEVGSQQTGAFFALWSVATKLSLAVSGSVALFLLDLAGFAGEAGNATGMEVLVALYAGAPILLKGAAICLMWGFPSDAARQADLRRRIETAAS